MLTLFKTEKSRKHATKLQQVTTYTASQNCDFFLRTWHCIIQKLARQVRDLIS